MATRYDLKKRRDMSKDAPEGSQLYYAVSKSIGVCTAETLYGSIADRSALTEGDVKNVVDGFMFVLEQRLQEGQSVQLGDLGYFFPMLGSPGVKKPEDFKPVMIKKRRIIFRPGKALMEFSRNMQVERIGHTAENGSNDNAGGDDIL